MKTAEKIKHFKPTEYSIYKPHICFLSTYPPKPCGIATFARDLLTNVDHYNPLVPSSVIALQESGEKYDYPPEVIKIITRDNIQSYRESAEFLNDSDIEVVSIQHEFGIFGGADGNYLLEFLKYLKKPVVITLHTVLPNPSFEMRETLRKIGEFSHTLVVMTKKGRELLKEYYGISRRKIDVIYHGVPFVFLRPTQFAKDKCLFILGNKVRVIIEVNSSYSDREIKQDCEHIIIKNRYRDTIKALVPVDDLVFLAQKDYVRLIRAPYKPVAEAKATAVE